MKKLIFTLIVFCSMFTARAQSDSNYVEIGVNTIRMINLGLNASALNYDIWNPYILTVEGHIKRLGIRVGLGMRASSQTELPTDANGLTKTEMDTSRRDIRFGLGWEFQMAKKWTFKAGIDYFTSSEKNTFSTDFDNEDNMNVVTTHEKKKDEKGVSPFLYIQYHITPRVSVGTEMLWRFSNYTSSDIDSSNLNNNDMVRKFEGSKNMIMAPTALFLNVRF